MTWHRTVKTGAIAALSLALFAPLGPLGGPLAGVGPAEASETIPITRSLLKRLQRRSEAGRRGYRGDAVYVRAVWKDVGKAVDEEGEKLDLDLIESIRVKRRLGHYGSEEKALKILQDYGEEIHAAHMATGVRPSLIVTVIGVESGGNPKAVSPVGAQGLMQLMPETAKRFGVSNSFDPAQNIMGGSKYLAFLMKHFEGDHVLALAGYNAGEHRIEEYDGVPPFTETRGYLIKAAAFIDDARAVSRREGARSPLPIPRPVGLTDPKPEDSAASIAPALATQGVGGFDHWLTPVN